MIDWLTLKLPLPTLGKSDLETILNIGNEHVVVVDANKEITKKYLRKQPIIYDGRQVNVAVSSGLLEISGSPSKAIGEPNLFGSADIVECSVNMISVLKESLSIALPDELARWRCTQLDFALDYNLISDEQVAEVLRALISMYAGEPHISTHYNTIYWNRKSEYEFGKAYAKGPQLIDQFKKNKISIEDEKLTSTQKLLRLEWSLRNKGFQNLDVPWYELSSDYLHSRHVNFFSKRIPDNFTMNNVFERLTRFCKSQNKAVHLYGIYYLIKQESMSWLKDVLNHSTYHSYIGQLKDAGLSEADLLYKNSTKLESLDLDINKPILSWEELLYNDNKIR